MQNDAYDDGVESSSGLRSKISATIETASWESAGALGEDQDPFPGRTEHGITAQNPWSSEVLVSIYDRPMLPSEMRLLES